MESSKYVCLNEEVLIKVRRKLMNWGIENNRDFPWRNTSDTYRVLIAEIFLHRTKASQAKQIYEIFIDKYPNFESILKMPKRFIMKELKSLGLSWRVDKLYALSKVVVKKFGGKIPVEKETLLSLPGIGEYTASAIICFSLNRPEPVLDTNTVRILSRVCGLRATDSSRRSKKFESIMRDFIGDNDPRKVSFSMLDLGARICIHRYPKCEICPINKFCNFAKQRRDN